ncbi:hypothetical protein [Rhizobium nepotum]|uniref:hypothetical protein n=1 Tax=Rhizobium nepotum TaxID=1035271 RepID=UPI003CED3E29
MKLVIASYLFSILFMTATSHAQETFEAKSSSEVVIDFRKLARRGKRRRRFVQGHPVCRIARRQSALARSSSAR